MNKTTLVSIFIPLIAVIALNTYRTNEREELARSITAVATEQQEMRQIEEHKILALDKKLKLKQWQKDIVQYKKKIHIGMTTLNMLNALGDPKRLEAFVNSKYWYRGAPCGGPERDCYIEVYRGKILSFWNIHGSAIDYKKGT